MMLAELYRIGLSMRQGEDWPTEMYDERKIRWDVSLESDGKLIDVVSIDPKDKSLGRVSAPDVDRANGVIPYLIVDKPEYVLAEGKNGQAQHSAYLDLLDRCALDTGSRAVKAVADYLRGHRGELVAALVNKGFGAKDKSAKGIQANEWMNFSVDGRYPIEEPAVQSWWAQYARDELDRCETCAISATYGKITRKFPVSIRVNGTSCKLASVDSPACKSYGYDKTDHFPMSHDAALVAGTALKQLLANPQSNKRLGDVNFAFWTRNGAIRDGLMAFAFGAEEEGHSSEVRAFLDSVFSGVVHDLSDEMFYMIVATNTKSRIVIRASIEAPLELVIGNVRGWFGAIDIAGPDSKPLNLTDLHNSLQVSNKRQSRNVQLALVKHAFFGDRLERTIYSMVFPRIESSIHNAKRQPRWRCPSKEQVSVIKLYLSQLNPEVREMVVLQEDCPDVAYQYGRLMAVYEAIQLDASPNVQSTVSERFFTSMMVSPKRSVAKLDSLSRAHLRKGARELGKGWAVNKSKRLQSINKAISWEEASECGGFTLDQRGMFVLGYWHEKFRTYNPEKTKEITDEPEVQQD
jgi:CRISPR-associated protein Csd1